MHCSKTNLAAAAVPIAWAQAGALPGTIGVAVSGDTEPAFFNALRLRLHVWGYQITYQAPWYTSMLLFAVAVAAVAVAARATPRTDNPTRPA
jgi:hypothetical protein